MPIDQSQQVKNKTQDFIKWMDQEAIQKNLDRSIQTNQTILPKVETQQGAPS